MKIRLCITFIALSMYACSQSPNESVVLVSDSMIIDLKSFGSYHGFAYEGVYRKGVVVTTLPNGDPNSIEIWFQEADSSTAITEWTAKSASISVDRLSPGTLKAVLRDVRYEKIIGAEGMAFPASSLELRFTRMGGDTLRLDIPSPEGMPLPLPLQDGSMLLVKDIYLR